MSKRVLDWIQKHMVWPEAWLQQHVMECFSKFIFERDTFQTICDFEWNKPTEDKDTINAKIKELLLAIVPASHRFVRIEDETNYMRSDMTENEHPETIWIACSPNKGSLLAVVCLSLNGGGNTLRIDAKKILTSLERNLMSTILAEKIHKRDMVQLFNVMMQRVEVVLKKHTPEDQVTFTPFTVIITETKQMRTIIHDSALWPKLLSIMADHLGHSLDPVGKLTAAEMDHIQREPWRENICRFRYRGGLLSIEAFSGLDARPVITFGSRYMRLFYEHTPPKSTILSDSLIECFMQEGSQLGENSLPVAPPGAVESLPGPD